VLGLETVHSRIVADEKDKPGFDEQTLGRLLEAAFVLQEHSQELKEIRADLERRVKDGATPAPAPAKAHEAEHSNGSGSGEGADYAATLAQIIDLQRRIQTQHLSTKEAMSLVAEQAIEVCGSAGAAIGLVSAKSLSYRAVAGIRTLPVGSTVPLEKALCFPCIRSGQVFSCADIKAEILVNMEECRRRGIGSLIAVPIFREGGIAGGLEIYFSDPGAFTDEDLHTSQLMAALVTEALAAGVEGRETGQPARKRSDGSQSKSGPRSPLPSEQQNSELEDGAAVCYKCGHELLKEEQFCGECGAPRSSESLSPSLQSKVASLWHKQQAGKAGGLITRSAKPVPAQEAAAKPATKAAEANEGTPHQPSTAIQTVSKPPVEAELEASTAIEAAEIPAQVEAESGAPPKPTADHPASSPEPARSADWSSALSAKQFFDQFSAGNRRSALIQFWNARRGDIYLAIALILVVCVIGWGIRSNRAVKATAPPKPNAAPAHKQAAAPELPLFDRMLISLGLAEAPQPPEYKGNPSVQVWEDLRTGLYYCPGADMYGRTPKGKYTSQRDAQLDRFEPAYRKACD
jgi:GAF domain-containing protein